MASSGSFPAVDAEKELNPGFNKDFQVDPVSSNVATTKQIEDQIKAIKLEEREKKDDLQSFKTTLIVSGIVVAVAGAVFAITKKLREK
ncbi:hypothetical protein PHJA_002753600 [Phtheirospermum japonicum]|uniref:Uncharacterized protein n=1 Tax=Phtheirospermum japonicum TaxID=374723 RepID=A0A830DH38_9LAMI|nr:hypothetical protein PHJA_002753600 [Phtheirospermum japonicum]